MPIVRNRWQFLTALWSAAAAGVLGTRPVSAGEGDLETRSVRIFANRLGICVAPQYIAEPLLQAEGFTDVHYVGLKGTSVGVQGVGSSQPQKIITDGTDWRFLDEVKRELKA